MISEIEKLLIDYRDYLESNTNCSVQTISKYYNAVRQMLLNTSCKWDDIKTVNSWLSKKSKESNVYLYRYAIKHFYLANGRKSLGEDLINPKPKKREKVFKYIKKETVQQIINQLPVKYRKLAFLQYKTGARVGSILTLRAENIDFDLHDKLIYITIGVNKSLSKGSKEIKLRLSKDYEMMLRSWISKPFGYLFLSEKFENYDDETLMKKLDTIRRSYNDSLARIGRFHEISGLCSHYLRHLFADNFLKSGGKIEYLQLILGHSKVETTMRYVSIGDQMADEAILRAS